MADKLESLLKSTKIEALQKEFLKIDEEIDQKIKIINKKIAKNRIKKGIIYALVFSGGFLSGYLIQGHSTNPKPEAIYEYECCKPYGPFENYRCKLSE